MTGRPAARTPGQGTGRGPAARALLGACALAGLAACVTVPQFQALQRDVEELQASRSGGSSGASEARLADLGVELDELRREIGVLKGEVQELRRVAEEALAVSKDRPEAPEGPPPAAARGASPELNLEVREYEEAFRHYRDGDYTAAIDRFRAFLQNHPSSDYADNALFWMGESNFRLGDFERAVLTFEEVAQRYPEGNKVPDALYRQGAALLELGRRDGQLASYEPAAREIFERIVNDYPQSERVPEARRQLEKLRQ